jgi:hypothetical protein
VNEGERDARGTRSVLEFLGERVTVFWNFKMVDIQRRRPLGVEQESRTGLRVCD